MHIDEIFKSDILTIIDRLAGGVEYFLFDCDQPLLAPAI